MNYKGYEVDPSYIEGGEIKWQHIGSNGDAILGTKGGKKFFIKKNLNVCLGSPDMSPEARAVYDEAASFIENKQKKLRSLMSGLTVEGDHVVYEEDNFWDMDDRSFVTVTRYLDGCVDDKYDFASESVATKKDLLIKMASLVKTLHTHGIIHCDLKLGNFLFKKNGSGFDVYVIDFDSSFPAAEVPWPVRVPFTPGYETPEVILYRDRAETDDDMTYAGLITPGTDIFTLSLIFHKLWNGALPGYGVEAASYGLAVTEDPTQKAIMDRSLDEIIGTNSNATYISLLNWMLARNPKNRPTIDQVIAVLQDKESVPMEYIVGKDKPPFDGLWGAHENIATYDEAALKAKGVLSFQKVNNGGLKYLVRTEEGEETYTIDELINEHLIDEKPVSVCDPYPTDIIEFLAPDVIKSKGIMIIEQDDPNQKLYKVTTRNNTSSYRDGKSLIAAGVAREKQPDPIDFEEPWPEDRAVWASKEFMEKKHVKLIRPALQGSAHVYIVEYDDPAKEPKTLPGKTLLLLGFLVLKR